MPKIKIEANELIDVDATHVSLVKRGANRVPFRIVKNADGKRSPAMFHFDRLFRKEAAPAAPAVSAIVVSKSLTAKQAKHVVTKAGFDADRMNDEHDGAYVFPQIDGDIDGKLVKMDDNIAIVVTGEAIQKAFEGMNFEATSFDTVMAQEGFVPSIDMAMGMLRNTVANILSKAESRDDLVSKMEQAVEEFGEFVAALSTAVPDDAFRMEVMKYDDLPDAEEGDEPAEGEAEGDASDDSLSGQIAKAMHGDKDKRKRRGNKTKEGDEAETKAKSDDEVEEGQEAAEGEAEGGDEGAHDEPAAADASEDMAAMIAQSIQAAMAPVTEAIESMQKTVAKTNDELAEVKTKAEQADKVAKAAQTAVKGRVNGDAGGDPDPEPKRKAETQRGDPPLIDTGYPNLMQ